MSLGGHPLRGRCGRVLIALLVLLAFRAEGQQAGPRRALVADEGIIYYRRSDEANAQAVSEAIRTNLPRISQALGTQFEGPLRLYLCASLEEFEQLAAGNPGPWVLGQALPERKVIVMKSMPAASTLERLVLHELTHVVFAEALGDALGAAPTWFDEGVAVFLSGEWGPGHETTLSAAVREGRMIPFADLEDDFPEDPMHAGLAYAQSGSFVQFLVGDASSGRLAGLIAALRETQDMPGAIEDVFGESLEVLERRWRGGIARSHGWQPTCGRMGDVIFGAMALLVILAFIARRVRRGRRIAETEDEDEEGLWPWEEEEDF